MLKALLFWKNKTKQNQTTLQLRILPFCLNTVSCTERYMMFLPPSSPFISFSTSSHQFLQLPPSVTADAVQSGSRITPSSWSMENSTQANRATFPHIIPGTHNLPTKFQETVQSAKNSEIKSGRVYQSASGPMLHSWDLNILVSFTNLVFLLAMPLWYQHLTANILLWGYKKKKQRN